MFQMFKGAFYYCDGPDVRDVKNKTDCLNKDPRIYRWINRKYNFDNLGQVCSLMTFMHSFMNICIYLFVHKIVLRTLGMDPMIESDLIRQAVHVFMLIIFILTRVPFYF